MRSDGYLTLINDVVKMSYDHEQKFLLKGFKINDNSYEV